LSSFACTMLTDAMALIPGNERFQKRIEYANLTHILFGPKFYIVQQICYNLAMQSLNIASIVVTAQATEPSFELHPSFGFVQKFPYYNSDENRPS
jgi:hypothetical protein